MKVLMVGLGSIGQRHLRNLKRLYGEGLEVLAYRVRRNRQTFDDRMKIRDGVDLEKEFHIRVFSDLDKALEEHPQAVFVTNITASHMKCALRAAEAGCDIFLEKPVSDSMAGTDELIRMVAEKNVIIYVGYQNRFHPCIQETKKLLDEGRIGRLISVDNEFSERLTTMHTYEDYSQTYMARKEMGGGPILNLQIHCLDYLQWMLGTPVSAYSLAGHGSGLDIDVEDYASTLYRFLQPDGSELPVYSHTDFLQYPAVHILKLVGEKGRMELDLARTVIKVIIGDTLAEERLYSEFERNDMFIQELKEFVYCMENRVQPESGLLQGITGLKMALAAKKSAEEKRVVLLEEIK